MIATTELIAMGNYPAADRSMVANRLADFARVLIVSEGQRGRIIVYVPITSYTMARDALAAAAPVLVAS